MPFGPATARLIPHPGKFTGFAGNTVITATAEYTNSIGAVELKGEWQDPEFDPKARTIYYVRVLEIPTPRWTTYLAVKSNLPVPTEVPASIQQRALSSPIYYDP